LLARRYTYDAADNLTLPEDQRSGSALAATRYQYDRLGRIEGALRSAGGTSTLDEVFNFDPAHNIVGAGGSGGGSSGTGSAHSNAAATLNNRLTVFEDKRFAYDAHGNLPPIAVPVYIPGEH
jgi:hypothetical protein